MGAMLSWGWVFVASVGVLTALYVTLGLILNRGKFPVRRWPPPDELHSLPLFEMRLFTLTGVMFAIDSTRTSGSISSLWFAMACGTPSERAIKEKTFSDRAWV